MEKKRKYILVLLIAVVVLGAIIYTIKEDKDAAAKKIADLPLTHEYAETDFYYEQLNSMERKIYDKLIEKLDAYQGGEIILEENISVNNLSRIADAIRFNDGNNYFYMLFTVPFTDDNRVVNWSTTQSGEELEKKQIGKILLEIYIGEEDKRLDGFQVSDDLVFTNFDEQKKNFETIPESLITRYDTVKKETEQILDGIIADMPKNLNQEEAVNYFSQWMIDNMVYTPSFTPGTQFGDVVNDDVQFSFALASLTRENGVCSGFAMVLSELCKRVGIESYVCLGTSSYGGAPASHAWTAVVIGDKTYYTDPTVSVGTQTVSRLKRREELDSGSYILRLGDGFEF